MAARKSTDQTRGARGAYEGGQASRERFVTATAELLQERGYYGTGLNEILARSGAPRGSLYYHFPGGKDELAVAALEYSGARLGTVLRERLAGAPDFAAGVCAIFDYFRAELRASDFRKACPIATVAQEVGGEHGALQAACCAIYAGWEELLTQALTLASGATASADGPAIAALRQTSRLALGMIEGALLLAKTRRDVSYLDLAQQQLLALLPRPGC